MTTVGPELDAARAQVVERGLTPDAVGRLVGVVSGFSLESLAPVKQQLKRFFSLEPWTPADDDALAAAIGEGTGSGREELAPGLVMQWTFENDRFVLRVLDEHRTRGSAGPPADTPPAGTDLDATFAASVVPEATPSARTIRFATPRLHDGPSRAYATREHVDDARVARVVEAFPDVTDVLVGPDFVAVTIGRPDRWEAVLAPMLTIVSAEFGDTETAETAVSPDPSSHRSPRPEAGGDRPDAPRRLERAWAELGNLRAGRAEDLEHVLAAAGDREPARRQVAAALLAEAPFDAAGPAWKQLLADPSRVVRRSAVDAVAGAAREELRRLLELALDDADAWTRWKALRGLETIGVAPSRDAVAARAEDTDFRVRLEAGRALATHPNR